MFYVVIESRIGDYETMPHYSVYGPYTNKGYAREVLRNMSSVHGGDLPRGADNYVSKRYHTGLLNTHYGTLIDSEGYTNKRHETINVANMATKFNWS